MSTKQVWWCVGSTVEHKKTGRKGKILKFKGRTQLETALIDWEDGPPQWVSRKQLRSLDKY